MGWDSIRQKVLDYFRDNDDDFEKCLRDLDYYIDYIEAHSDTIYYPMSDFNDYYDFMPPLELIDAVDSSFSSGDDYFYEDSWGEICSTNYPDYSDLLDHEFVDALYDEREREYIRLPEYVAKLFNAYSGEDDEDEEDSIEEDEI